MAYDPERIVNIGELEKRGKTVRFGIKEKDRSRHIYVIGQTGTGKSTLLEMLAMQDIRNGTGLIFMDPHGQSVEALLHYVTPEYLDDIIYFAPHHQERPIGLNIMEDIGYDKRHLVVSSLMASFEKIWGAGTWSDRMAYILQNTLLALIEYPGTTLLDVGRMYSSKGFREKVVANLKDPQVRKYWVEEFANYTERYAQEATPSIQNKLGQFTSNPLMRNIIGQKESAFNFREIMDEGKILLVNLSKGQIGENNARMLGVLFTTKIYLAALSRSDMAKQELEVANPCNFFVDEFQSFANSSFSDILSEARKYKLNLVMAHQYLGQLYSDDSGGGDVIRDAVFGNVGTFISFRVGPVDAEIISKQFAPDIMEEDLVALPRYHIYLTLNIDGAGSTPFSARTFYEPAPEGVSLEEEVVRRTMATYGVDRAVVEKMVEDNLAEDAQLNEMAKKSGGQKGGGQKGGWQKGGGQKGVGQKGGGKQNRYGNDQGPAETHTPLKGLVRQMMQQSDQPKVKQLKEQGGVADKIERRSKSGEVERKVGGVSGVPKAKKLQGAGENVANEKAGVSEKEVSERSKEGVGQWREVGGRGKRDADTTRATKVRPLKKQGGDGTHVEKGKGRRVVERSGKMQDVSERVVREKKQDVVEKPKDVRVADASEDHPSHSNRKRKRRGRGLGDDVSKRSQGGGSVRFVSGDVAIHREERGAVVRDGGQQRGQRVVGRSEDRRQQVRAVRNKEQRQKGQRNRREGSTQEKDVSMQSDLRVEKEKGGSVARKKDVVQVKQGAVQMRRGKKRAERLMQKERLPASDTLRRPDGVIAGAVSRSAVAQQSVSDQRSVRSDASGKQQGIESERGGQQQSGQQRGRYAGGLGDLVKTTKATGLRKDLKVAPKKEKHAPPISYEEGWVAIGDIS